MTRIPSTATSSALIEFVLSTGSHVEQRTNDTE